MLTTALWILMNASIIADWGQTRHIANHPQRYEEVNHFLGKHPSVSEVNRWFVGSLIVNNSIVIVLPRKYRGAYAGVYSAVTIAGVMRNNSIGIQISF